ncbi:hypothetical protein B1218_36240, partial [Pseudomonas ogarae]
ARGRGREGGAKVAQGGGERAAGAEEEVAASESGTGHAPGARDSVGAGGWRRVGEGKEGRGAGGAQGQEVGQEGGRQHTPAVGEEAK